MLRVTVLVASVGAVLAVGAVKAPPPGATARCADGTFSYSQHHSGTCSHHGGVATWLDGGTAAPASRPTGPTVAVGRTILLAARTRTSGCVLGVEPDRRCSPGAIYSGLSVSVLCSTGFHTSSIRNVSETERHQVEIEYGLAPRAYGSALEIDHIVPLEAGGSNDIANLYPERAPGFHAKDTLENKVHELVCSGELRLADAQRSIAADWRRLYERVFGVAAKG
jgi:hypothetical protein